MYGTYPFCRLGRAQEDDFSGADRCGSEATVRFYGTIANTPDALRGLEETGERRPGLHFCYEAGPCGYGVQRQLTGLGIAVMWWRRR